MKRKKDLYADIYKFDNIVCAFNEVCKNTKSKRKVANLKESLFLFDLLIVYYLNYAINNYIYCLLAF